MHRRVELGVGHGAHRVTAGSGSGTKTGSGAAGEHEAPGELRPNARGSRRGCACPAIPRAPAPRRTSAVLTATRFATSTVGRDPSRASARDRVLEADAVAQHTRVAGHQPLQTPRDVGSRHVGAASAASPGRPTVGGVGGALDRRAAHRSRRVASLPVGDAPGSMRVPKTRPSSREFDASRFAPWTPLHAASPHAHSPGSVVAPSRSVQMPPER